jgi:hypothetical protein
LQSLHLRRCVPFGMPSLLVFVPWQRGQVARVDLGFTGAIKGVVFRCGGEGEFGIRWLGIAFVDAWLLVVTSLPPVVDFLFELFVQTISV